MRHRQVSILLGPADAVALAATHIDHLSEIEGVVGIPEQPTLAALPLAGVATHVQGYGNRRSDPRDVMEKSDSGAVIERQVLSGRADDFSVISVIQTFGHLTKNLEEGYAAHPGPTIIVLRSQRGQRKAGNDQRSSESGDHVERR